MGIYKINSDSMNYCQLAFRRCLVFFDCPLHLRVSSGGDMGARVSPFLSFTF